LISGRFKNGIVAAISCLGRHHCTRPDNDRFPDVGNPDGSGGRTGGRFEQNWVNGSNRALKPLGLALFNPSFKQWYRGR
jgi:hypothetical protein